jgi:primosomal protein N''
MAEIEDFELIEKAGFTHNTKFVAQTVVSSLSFLKSLSSKLGIPIEHITAEHIVREFAQTDAQIREHERKFAAFVAKKV